MAPVSPQRTVYVNRLWPQLTDAIETGADQQPLAPAGSSRDLFLHVTDDAVPEVAAELGGRLEGVADVVPTESLIDLGAFGCPSAALRSRVGNVAVLPRFGEAVWWLSPRFEQRFMGQHGGASPQELEIPLLAWVA